MRTAVLVMELWTALLLLEPEGVMVRTPPPIVDTMMSPDASVVVMISPLVKDEEAEAEVVKGLDEARAEEEEAGTEDTENDVDAASDEAGELEAAWALELDGTGRTEPRVDPCEMGGTGVATWGEDDPGAAGEV